MFLIKCACKDNKKIDTKQGLCYQKVKKEHKSITF